MTIIITFASLNCISILIIFNSETKFGKTRKKDKSFLADKKKLFTFVGELRPQGQDSDIEEMSMLSAE